MTNPDLFDKPRRCGCTSSTFCGRHDPRARLLRANLLALIPSGKDNRTVIAKIVHELYNISALEDRGFDALDMEVREQIKILKDEGHSVCTSKAGVWICTSPQDMKDSFIQRLRHGAAEIARVRLEAGSEMFKDLSGQVKLEKMING